MIVIGSVAGICGVILSLLLHLTQHVAYGYSPYLIMGDESFIEGVSAASPTRRLYVLMVCGLISGFGWWVICLFFKPLVEISTAIKSDIPYMPVWSTTFHALLQMITVGLGSPLGREVAPRELAATFSIWFSSKVGLSLEESRVMMACAAGAGLAAVYNVPFGGSVFALEVLLCTFRWNVVLPALITSALATVISRCGLGNVVQYHLHDSSVNFPLLILSIVSGPIFGYFGYIFSSYVKSARAKSQHDGWLPLTCFINFLIIGLLSIYYPAILGNGKTVVQIGLSNAIIPSVAVILLVLRVCIVLGSLRAGAHGGIITPALANGALLSILLCFMWNMYFPYVSQSAFAVVGATAFLATSQKMPITAIIFVAEITGINFQFLLPMLFAVAGSIGVRFVLEKNLAVKVPVN